jgi:hypothetical protein
MDYWPKTLKNTLKQRSQLDHECLNTAPVRAVVQHARCHNDGYETGIELHFAMLQDCASELHRALPIKL